MRDARYGMRDTGYGIRDARYGRRDTRYAIRVNGYGIRALNSGSRIPNHGSRIPYLASRISHLISRISYPASHIPYLISRIANRISRDSHLASRSSHPGARISRGSIWPHRHAGEEDVVQFGLNRGEKRGPHLVEAEAADFLAGREFLERGVRSYSCSAGKMVFQSRFMSTTVSSSFWLRPRLYRVFRWTTCQSA